jgi:hypothetical protein
MAGWLDGQGGNSKRETRWLTPPSLVQQLGRFDLDPCGAPGHVLAARTYLLENGDDGLSDPWDGRVWLNPPYGREQEPFLLRLAEHGNGIALIFAAVETRVFEQLVWAHADAVLFLRGRIKFLDANGKEARTNAGKPSVLVAYGQENVEALRRSRIPGVLIPVAHTERLIA